MYLREMGTVPLLTREGEVAIAKRIEQGKLAVIKSISRTPKVTQEVLEMGEQLKRGERTVRELVVFNEEEITDEKIAARQREFLKQIDRVQAGGRRRAASSQEKFADVDEDRQAQVPQGALEDRPRAHRGVTRDPPDRVHRNGEAPPDRRHQAGRRGHPGEAARSAPDRSEARSEGQAEAARGRKEDLPQAQGRVPQGNPRRWRRSSSSRSRS